MLARDCKSNAPTFRSHHAIFHSLPAHWTVEVLSITYAHCSDGSVQGRGEPVKQDPYS